MLSFVGDELGDGACPRSGGGSLVQKRVRQTLPQEVLEAVLLRLPAKSQAQCRAVCKAWLAMLSSPDFLRRNFYDSLSSLVTPPVCAFEHCVHDSEDDSDSDDEREPAKNVRGPSHKSLKVDLSFLPKVFHSRSAEVHSWSQSGLICIGCMSCTRSELHLCVVNPLNQIFKVLPMLTNPRGRGGLMTGRAVLITEGITGAEDIPSFKVYLHAASDKVEMAIYSSTSGEWKGFVGTPSNSSERDGYDDDEERPSLPMACNGAIYTLVGSTRPRLVRLSMDRGPRYLWDLTLPRFMHSRDHQRENKYFLADHRGRLLCCCGGIKMLDDVTQQWIEIADICPPEILPPCNPAKKHTLTLEKVQVAGDLVVFFHQVDIRRGKAGDHVDCPVAYDMLRRCWQKIPGKIFHIGDLFQALPNLRI